MSPLLEKETNIGKLYFNKFLRYGKNIIYDSPRKNHSVIASEHGGEVYVDDGGYIEPFGKFPYNENKIIFTSTTETCYIKGDKKEQRRITKITAKEILGEDKVAD